MEDAVKFSTRLRRLSGYLWVDEHCHAGGGHYRLTKFCTFIQSYLRPHERGFKRQTLYQRRGSEKCRDERAQKSSQQNFMRQGNMLSFERGTLLLRETVTMLRSRDVIHRRPVSFLWMIHVSLSVIIPVLKKKALLFDLGSWLLWRDYFGL